MPFVKKQSDLLADMSGKKFFFIEAFPKNIPIMVSKKLQQQRILR